MSAAARIRIDLAHELAAEERARHEGFMGLALAQAGRNQKRPLGR